MPVRNRRPEDDRPLFRAVDEQQLVRPPSGGRGEGEEPGVAGATQAAPQTEEASQSEKGPIARAVDKAQETNWVYPAMADRAREKGLLDKADEVLNRVKTRLGGN